MVEATARISERMHLHSELAGQPPAQQQRFAAGHPETVNSLDYFFPHSASEESWPLAELPTDDDISSKWDFAACRRRVLSE